MSIWSRQKPSDPWENVCFSRRLDPFWGDVLGAGDFFNPQRIWRGAAVAPRTQRQGGMSELVNNESEFRVAIDVQQFKPEEINIKTKDNSVIINACHEERPDEHGYVKREFTRQYRLPDDIDPNTVTSSLNGDGVLTIKAPRKALPETRERIIPITRETTPQVQQ
ncbi:hypothetical protein C0Q70_11721 [Pomacea canaliculata]|uniref:SHSP domain-containing protein n=1 Tax=Pomacea canaliculata TaxID=400727 RepID=A0A2T7P6S2_POMCA|nr:protein lethal(2)essential for life-like [Pomacea canaliculata]PVD29124.1 hypothetical protein C0Q70_11721 [Pomacea canaliculata]